jgi:hypothetical protein
MWGEDLTVQFVLLSNITAHDASGQQEEFTMVQVRYIVSDIEAAIVFYTQLLGFYLDMHPAPAFAMLSLGDLRLVHSVPNP